MHNGTAGLAAGLWEFGRGQGGRQFTELAIALLLSTAIGLERAVQQKSAGLRTHTLVGVGSALFMEVSQHGFDGMLGVEGIAFDPSRVAAQIVSGIGFIGGGLIFVRRNSVRGLTTAATVWLTCAIGMACGGGLLLLALGATVIHFLVVRGYPLITDRLSMTFAENSGDVLLAYRSGRGLLPSILEETTSRGLRVVAVTVEGASEPGPDSGGVSTVRLELAGRTDLGRLVTALAALDGVVKVGMVGDDGD
ncbi:MULTISPECIES: MgtC/SapB family protein [unclassified Streptomyces]|uniref:MgtC/SapB family protein n=1 Tax=unclassified Streptomyces TaxID=2593676 RepID=UPI0035D8DF96